MVAKLCISENGNYYLVHKDKSAYEPGFMIGSSFDRLYENNDIYKLSLKNCEAIKNGYDLDELANFYSTSTLFVKKNEIPTEKQIEDAEHISEIAFKAGFQKALELMGDKKFSENDMFRMFTYGHALTNAVKAKVIQDKPFGEIFNDFIQSLQQTEWIVEIEMVPYHDGNFVDDGHTHIIEVKSRPALDDDGCIILKRI